MLTLIGPAIATAITVAILLTVPVFGASAGTKFKSLSQTAGTSRSRSKTGTIRNKKKCKELGPDDTLNPYDSTQNYCKKSNVNKQKARKK